MIVTETKLK